MGPRARSTLTYMTTELFVDLETGGVDARRHPITEVAVLDVDGHIVLHRRVAVEEDDVLEPEAIDLNGYDPKLWRETASSWSSVADELAAIFDVEPQPIMVGHFVHFEYGFLREHMGRAGHDPNLVPRTLVDTRALAHEHLGSVLCTGALAFLVEILGLHPRGPIHRATEDADLARRAYLRLRRAGPLRRAAWRMRAWWLGRKSR